MPAASVDVVGMLGETLVQALEKARQLWWISRAGFNPASRDCYAVMTEEKEYIVANGKVVRVDERLVSYGVWRDHGKRGHK